MIANAEFRIPDYIKSLAPWLSLDYVLEWGFYPALDRRLGEFAQDTNMWHHSPSLGGFPYASRTEIKEGAVIIFDNYNEWHENKKYETDRFAVIDKEAIQDYLNRQRDLLPVGIIVNPPAP